MKKTTNPAEIIRRIKECEGERISHEIQELHATFFIFSGNREQLLTAIRAFEHPTNMSTLWNVQNRPALRHFHKEIARLLHNYLASAATLIDHTRIFTRDLYQGNPFYEEYQKKRYEKGFSRKGVRSCNHTFLGEVTVSGTISRRGAGVWFISFVWFVWFLWLIGARNEQDKPAGLGPHGRAWRASFSVPLPSLLNPSTAIDPPRFDKVE